MEVINIPHATKNSQLTFARTANAEFVNPIENLMNNLIDLHKAFTVNSFRFAHKHNNPSPIGIMSMNDILTRLEW